MPAYRLYGLIRIMPFSNNIVKCRVKYKDISAFVFNNFIIRSFESLAVYNKGG